ncbi:MAG: AI-2E family transporter [Deltaproteobacteria bacterium]|nr:AI-2E family transporter [Deltaproteobacteria bacterium]
MSEPERTSSSEIPTNLSGELPAAKPLFGNEAIAPYFFVVLFILAILAVGYVLLPFLGDIVIAFLFVILLTPMYARLSRLLGNRQVLASALLVIGLVVVSAIPIFLIASALFSDIAEASRSWSADGRSLTLRAIAGRDGAIMDAISRVAASIGITVAPEWVEQALLDTGRSLTQYLAKQANAFLGSLFSTTLHTIVVLLAVFYLLVWGDRLRTFLYRLSPLKHDEDQIFISKLGEVGRAILVGAGTSSVLQGLVAGIAWVVVGLPSPVLWGIVMAIAAFLPLVGVAAVIIPATIYLWIEGRPLAAVVFLIFCMGQSYLFEYGLKPRLMGSSMRMNSLLVFLSLLGGIMGFGVRGLIYGPLIMTLFLALVQLYQNRYQQHIAQRLAPDILTGPDKPKG